MQLRRSWLLPASLIALAACPAAAQASIGVGIQAGPVKLSAAAHPGGSYALPPVYVVNTGTQQESLSITVQRVSAGAGQAVPASWIRAPGTAVQLAHNQAARIPLQLVIPATARPGAYSSDVIVRGSAAVPDGSAHLGVAAATKLEFTIAPGAAAGSWFSVPGWVLFAAAVMVLLAAAALLMRRTGLRIRIERDLADAGPAGAEGGNVG